MNKIRRNKAYLHHHKENNTSGRYKGSKPACKWPLRNSLPGRCIMAFDHLQVALKENLKESNLFNHVQVNC